MDFTKKYDVAVVGGGIAGAAAALQAARSGKKTVLIEKTVLLGGLATSGLVYIYLPICDGNGHQASYGITEELLRNSPRIWSRRHSRLLAEWEKRAGIQTFLLPFFSGGVHAFSGGTAAECRC